MLLGVPREVNRFFTSVACDASKPVRTALPAMVLSFLLAPHARRLKTIAGMVLGERVHGATISRRLVNRAWTTRDWYAQSAHRVMLETSRYERPLVKDRKRKFVLLIDTTLHSSVGERMENLMVMSRRQDSRRRSTRHHAFVMGLMITEKGVRIPLPRRSYYTKDYCRAHGKKYRTQTQLARLMIKDAVVPADADVTVVYDSAFDADVIHEICRDRRFREVFPLDPNRNLARNDTPYAAARAGAKVVDSTLDWSEKEFVPLTLEVSNEGFAWMRRRHVDNLRVNKTLRRYVVAARPLAVSRLGRCLIVASYKENPKVELLSGQSASWVACRRELAERRKKDRHKPSRWTGKVLACTDPDASPAEVIQWYEVRWQIELFFRELKSRMQLGCYVMMKFEAVERYLDLLLMGFLYLERMRLNELRASGKSPEVGDAPAHWRVTDRLRRLDESVMRFNLAYIAQRIQSRRGRAELLEKFARASCRVA